VLIRDVAVGVDADEHAVIVVSMGEGRYMRDGARSCWTFGGMGKLGIGQMMAIAVPICERVSASWSPRIALRSFHEPRLCIISRRTLEGAALVGTSFSAARFFLRLALLTGFSGGWVSGGGFHDPFCWGMTPTRPAEGSWVLKASGKKSLNSSNSSGASLNKTWT